MATMNISLPDEMKEWVEAQARSGDFANTSDYIRDLIRHDKERRQAIEDIQAALDEGIASGVAQEFGFDAFLEKKRREKVTN